MFVHYKTPGLILKKENRGEADQIFVIYTKNFGKLEIFAKAIRKISSKLRSGAEKFYLSEIEFIQAKNRKTLTDAVLTKKFRNISNDLNRLKAACQVSEITDDLIRGQEKDGKIWDLLTEVFKKLNNLQISPNGIPLIYHYFFWRLISELGYRMEFHNCSGCSKKINPGKIYFSPKAGGIICQYCFKKYRNSKAIEPGTVKILRIISKKNWELLAKIKIKQDHLKSLEAVLKSCLSYLLTIIK